VYLPHHGETILLTLKRSGAPVFVPFISLKYTICPTPDFSLIVFTRLFAVEG